MAPQFKVYLETSFISYLATALQKRISSDVNVAHRQLASRVWWEHDRERFRLFISDTVYRECANGHADAVRNRLKIIAQVETLAENEEIIELTKRLVKPVGPLPPNAEADATHIAYAGVYGCDYLLTWNFKHIANAVIQRSLYGVVQSYGYQPSIICTPEQLIGNRNF